MAKEKSKALSALKYVVSFLFVFTLVVATVLTSTTVGDTKVEALTVHTNTKAMFNGLTDFDELGSNYLYCLIIHDNTKRYLTATGDSNSAVVSCAPLAWSDYNTNRMQYRIWKMRRVATNTYTFENCKATGKYLNLTGDSNVNGTQLQTYAITDNASKWVLTACSGIEKYGVYTFRAKSHSNKYINLDTQTASKVQIWEDNSATNSGWIVLPLVQGFDSNALGYTQTNTKSTLSHVATGYNMTAPEPGSRTDFTRMVQSVTAPTTDVATTEKQKFQLGAYSGAGNYCLWSMLSLGTKNGSNNGVLAPVNAAYETAYGADGDSYRDYREGNRLSLFYKNPSSPLDQYTGFYIVYNMGKAGRGYLLLSITGNSTGNGNPSGYPSNTKGNLMTIELKDGATGHLRLTSLELCDTEQIWYFEAPVQVTVTDKSTDGVVNSTVLNETLFYNTKVLSSQYAKTYDGYHLTGQQEVLLDGAKSLTNTFSPNTYTIRYNSDGGAGSMEETSHTYNTVKNLSTNTFTKSHALNFDLGGGKGSSVASYNYTFSGWTTVQGSSTVNYEDGASVNIATTSNNATIDLYPVWEHSEYTLPEPTRDGYDFAGWAETNTLTDSTPFVSSINGITGDKNYYAFYVGVGADASLLPENVISAIPKVYHYDIAQGVDLSSEYEWYRIDKNGSQLINHTGIEYTAIADDKNHAIKCVIKSKFVNSELNSKEFTNTVVSALYVGDTLVDTDVIGDMSNSHYANKEGCYDDATLVNGGSIEAGQNAEFEFEAFDAKFNGIASQVIFGNAFNGANYTYKVYGYLGEYKVLLFTNLDYVANRDGVFAPSKDSNVGKAGIAFDRYVVEITNNSETNAITVSKIDITLLCLPNVYKLENLDNEKGYESLFVVGDGGFSENSCRTEQDGVQYFYKGDIIRIFVPVENGNKLTAGSHIVINGEKVFPTYSVPEVDENGNYYVIFDYTNYYECLVRGAGMLDTDLKQIMISDKAPADITISVKVDQKANDEIHGLNFGPLGAKIKTDTKQIRFGSVWYFDDHATENSWSREEAKGTYILQLKNILKNPETNDFYKYLVEKDPTFIAKWNSATDEDRYIVDNIVTDKGVELITGYLTDFINEWNAERKTSSTTDENGQKIEGKADMMSFGGAEIISEAKLYYYKTDENGNTFLEYSALMAIPTSYVDRQLIYIPYASFVADWDHGYLAPNNDKYADNIYLYQAPEAVYTYAGLENVTKAE